MSYTVQSFADACRSALTAQPGKAGRDAVTTLVQDALRDEAFVATAILNATEERAVVHEDPELGFCICIHVYQNEKQGGPHDHGPTWAIYGQAAGETEMTDWEVVTPAANGAPAKVRETRRYTMRPGDAHLYEPGDVHAPYRSGPTRLLRIEGINTEKVDRTPIEAV